ncbi:UDP-3-O-acyl-N-acetylglucosamine deacetylase [Acetobacter syzygii]|uniref:UDP-3-O-acyl-N-acetylglucosamine deacetylase n=1 Tax=Acetobacter syzygii TaxID=146476 RepID=UPI00156E159D|nr:UDP-3-O-acyl-N-acetylglucosamine deacetylase [Acetobacter syzygii]NSL93499.1 UDP-3-O-acyl-N-acetylglucosamine deacetylase [Acetobacter syzygii]
MDNLTGDLAPYSKSAEILPTTMRQMRKKHSPVQHTLHHAIHAVGIGLHTGRPITMTMEPAPAGHGIVFQRTDIPAAAPLPARYDHVVETRLSTVLGEKDRPENRVATIEHLMAALCGCGIDNARILVDGPETPVFDGSAADFVFLLDCAGRKAQDLPRRTIQVTKPVRVTHKDSWVELLPHDGATPHLSMSIDFPASAIGAQSYDLDLTPTSFRNELAANRTFTMRQEIEALHQAGLALGGSLDNAIVVDNDSVLNPTGLRCPDEFIRHKVMDAVGDLYLAGCVLNARFHGHRSGHTLNNKLLHTLFEQNTGWQDMTNLQSTSAAA